MHVNASVFGSDSGSICWGIAMGVTSVILYRSGPKILILRGRVLFDAVISSLGGIDVTSGDFRARQVPTMRLYGTLAITRNSSTT